MKHIKFGKKLLCKILCAALILSSITIPGNTQEVQAASKAEVEASGTVLALNQTATDVLQANRKQNWFIFNITERGYFSVDFSRNNSADTNNIKDGWRYSVYHEYDLVNPISSISEIKNQYTGKELPMPKGRYYICVEASNLSSDLWCPFDCAYDIRVNFTRTDSWEQEYNDSNSTPNSIDVNKVYYGSFHRASDEDWYKVTLPGDGTIQLDFGPDPLTNVDNIKDGWNVTIFDEKLQTVRAYNYVAKWMPQVLPFEKNTFYIRVKSVHSSPFWQPIGCIYDLRLNFTPATDWETEYNGEYAKADVITSGREYHGVLSWASDEDWYRIDNEDDAASSLQFRLDDSVSVDKIHDGWYILVYNANREKITEISDIKTTVKKEQIRLPKGTTYIKVSAESKSDSWAPIDCIYHIAVISSKVTNPGENNNNAIKKAVTKGKVTTRTITSKKKKTVSLRWKKFKYAGGYEVYRSTKKKSGYKKVKTIKSGSTVSWTDKKVKGGKTYYYKIRAYCKIAGKKAVSQFSNVKRVKVKK